MSGFSGRVPEARELWDTIDRLMEMHQHKPEVSAAWFATEGMKILRFSAADNRPVYWGCHMALREIARHRFRHAFDPIERLQDEDSGQGDLAFAETLQDRYPLRPKKGEERRYRLLEQIGDDDLLYNEERLRRAGRAFLKHADAVLAYRSHRGGGAAAAA